MFFRCSVQRTDNMSLPAKKYAVGSFFGKIPNDFLFSKLSSVTIIRSLTSSDFSSFIRYFLEMTRTISDFNCSGISGAYRHAATPSGIPPRSGILSARLTKNTSLFPDCNFFNLFASFFYDYTTNGKTKNKLSGRNTSKNRMKAHEACLTFGNKTYKPCSEE